MVKIVKLFNNFLLLIKSFLCGFIFFYYSDARSEGTGTGTGMEGGKAFSFIPQMMPQNSFLAY